jgi:hypothetical protein
MRKAFAVGVPDPLPPAQQAGGGDQLDLDVGPAVQLLLRPSPPGDRRMWPWAGSPWKSSAVSFVRWPSAARPTSTCITSTAPSCTGPVMRPIFRCPTAASI